MERSSRPMVSHVGSSFTMFSLMSFPRRGGAARIQQQLRRAFGAGEQYETRSAGELPAGEQQSVVGRRAPRLRNVARQYLEGVPFEMLALQTPRLEARPTDEHRGPFAAKATRRPIERGDHRCAQALEVNMQLVLAARARRIDGEPHDVARHGTSDPAVQQAAGLPRQSEVVGGVRPGEQGTFDAGNILDGDEQKVRSSLAVREQRVTLRAPGIAEHDLYARGGIMARKPVG